MRYCLDLGLQWFILPVLHKKKTLSKVEYANDGTEEHRKWISDEAVDSQEAAFTSLIGSLCSSWNRRE
jgi:hypothetical protein